MKASELIEALQYMIDMHGDLPMYRFDDDVECTLEEPLHERPQECPRYSLPERFTL